MKKIFLKLTEEKDGHEIPDEARTKNVVLVQLVMFLEAWGNRSYDPLLDCNGLNWAWLRLDKLEEHNQVCLWDKSSIKKQAKKEGLSQMEQDAFDAAYDAYTDKRWADMPILDMMIKNYVEILQTWQKIVLQERPNYIIFHRMLLTMLI